MIQSLILIATLGVPDGKAGITALQFSAVQPETVCNQVQRPNWMITTRRAPPLTQRCDG